MHKRGRRVVFGAVCLALAGVGLSPAYGDAAPSRQFVTAQPVTPYLQQVALVSNSSVAWALGQDQFHQQTIDLRRHNTWTSILVNPYPVSTTDSVSLGEVTPISKSAAWVAGTRINETGERPYLGRVTTAGLKRVRTHVKTEGSINSVATSGPNNTWASGVRYVNKGRELLLHWDGTSWQRVHIADPDPTHHHLELGGVSTSGARNTWLGIVGGTSNHGFDELAHWDGTSWTLLTQPPPHCAFLGIVTTSRAHTWGLVMRTNPVGSAYDSSYGVMTWDGTSFSDPIFLDDGIRLEGFATLGSTAYVSGARTDSDGDQHPIILALDGDDWMAQPTNFGSVYGELTSISLSSKASIAVGTQSPTPPDPKAPYGIRPLLARQLQDGWHSSSR